MSASRIFTNKTETTKNEYMKPTTKNLTNILKAKPGQIIPITAQFSAIPPVKKQPLIKPKAGPEKYDGKDRVEVEHWLSFCAIGTQIIDTDTKMLAHKGLINGRDAVFDLIAAFKQLNKHFTGNENYDQKEMGIEDFVFSFLTGDEEHQNRVIKFQESILNKK